MNPQAAQSYLRTKVLTATPEQLQMMLFDGAVRFGEQAKTALENRNFEQSYVLISKVQHILSELICSLKRETYPELCAKLSSLYNYAYKHLIRASIYREVPAMEEALKVLRFQRETWQLLMAHIGKQKAAVVASKIPIPSPDEKMEQSISMQG